MSREISFLYNIKIISLMLFVFSLPFLYWDPFGVRSYFTITKGLGISYVLLSIYRFERNFRLTGSNRQLLYVLFMFFFWETSVSFVSSLFYHTDGFFNFTLAQNILLFWLVSNDFCYNVRIRKSIFLSFVGGVLLASTLLSFGFGIQSRLGDDLDIDTVTRVYFFGMNPNSFGNLASLAVLLILSLVVYIMKTKFKYLLLTLIPVLLAVIGYSGSRGSFLNVFIGIFVFFLVKKSSVKQRFLYIFLAISASLFIYNYLKEFETLQTRLLSTIESGDSGGRFEIWESVLKVALINPIFGVGVGYDAEITRVVGYFKDPHNMFLYIFASFGVVGVLIFIGFILRLYQKAANALKYNNDSTGVMMLSVLLFISLRSGGIIEAQYLWFFFASISVGASNSFFEYSNSKGRRINF